MPSMHPLATLAAVPIEGKEVEDKEELALTLRSPK